jgi:hypothetical protein
MAFRVQDGKVTESHRKAQVMKPKLKAAFRRWSGVAPTQWRATAAAERGVD